MNEWIKPTDQIQYKTINSPSKTLLHFKWPQIVQLSVVFLLCQICSLYCKDSITICFLWTNHIKCMQLNQPLLQMQFVIWPLGGDRCKQMPLGCNPACMCFDLHFGLTTCAETDLNTDVQRKWGLTLSRARATLKMMFSPWKRRTICENRNNRNTTATFICMCSF